MKSGEVVPLIPVELTETQWTLTVLTLEQRFKDLTARIQASKDKAFISNNIQLASDLEQSIKAMLKSFNDHCKEIDGDLVLADGGGDKLQ